MATVTGVVEAKSNKFDKFSILVNDTWYSSKYEIKADRGDTVEFDDGGKKYARRVRVTAKGSGAAAPASSGHSAPAARQPGFPVGVDTKDRSIVRQNSLGHAVKLVSSLVGQTEAGSWEDRETSTENIAKLCIEVARIFEDYSAGDGDAAEAEEMLAEE